MAAVACDRVYGTLQHIVCLKTNRGLVTNFEAVVLNPDWQQARSWSLPGIPSRTRISPDGSLVATTVFVSGHSYGNWELFDGDFHLRGAGRHRRREP